MKILLHSNQLGLGGTEVALWDYAKGCADILKLDVLIAAPKASYLHPQILSKFASRFDLCLYNDLSELRRTASARQIDVAYFIVEGRRQNELLIPGVKNVVHAVFPFHEPFGDVYAYISEWASSTSKHMIPWVPHIVDPVQAPVSTRLRTELGIPEDAVVFGSYGSPRQFDIKFVHNVIRELARSHKHKYFLFMNFVPFMDNTQNVRFLEGTHDDLCKAEFIDACDAMLHARSRGETFGLAAAEFSARNKPVITYALSPETAHIQMLGDSALLYKHTNELRILLEDFKPASGKIWYSHYADCTPTKVMPKFQQIFLSN